MVCGVPAPAVAGSPLGTVLSEGFAAALTAAFLRIRPLTFPNGCGTSVHSGLKSRVYVVLAARAVQAGASQCPVGTGEEPRGRALLGR